MTKHGPVVSHYMDFGSLSSGSVTVTASIDSASMLSAFASFSTSAPSTRSVKFWLTGGGGGVGVSGVELLLPQALNTKQQARPSSKPINVFFIIILFS